LNIPKKQRVKIGTSSLMNTTTNQQAQGSQNKNAKQPTERRRP